MQTCKFLISSSIKSTFIPLYAYLKVLDLILNQIGFHSITYIHIWKLWISSSRRSAFIPLHIYISENSRSHPQEDQLSFHYMQTWKLWISSSRRSAFIPLHICIPESFRSHPQEDRLSYIGTSTYLKALDLILKKIVKPRLLPNLLLLRQEDGGMPENHLFTNL